MLFIQECQVNGLVPDQQLTLQCNHLVQLIKRKYIDRGSNVPSSKTEQIRCMYIDWQKRKASIIYKFTSLQVNSYLHQKVINLLNWHINNRTTYIFIQTLNVHILCSIHLNIESINKHKCTHIYIYIYPYKHKHIHIQTIKTKQELCINKHKCTHIYIYIYPYKHKHIHIQNIKIKQELLFLF